MEMYIWWCVADFFGSAAERPESTFWVLLVGSFSLNADEQGLTEENEKAAPRFYIYCMIMTRSVAFHSKGSE